MTLRALQPICEQLLQHSFDDETSLGLVRLRAKRASVEIAKLG